MNKEIKELFERYQHGKASKQEIKLIEEWFASFDKDQPLVNDSQRSAALDQLDQEMAELFPVTKVRPMWGRRLLQAAAVLLLAGAGVFLVKLFSAKVPVAPVTYTSIAANYGQKRSLQLPDGTLAYLNSGSAIRIPSNYGKANRHIELKGEAFFMVKHDAAKPFSINTGKITIADIGTSFNIKAYPDDKQVRVAVESGIVEIDKTNEGAKPETYAKALTKNQQFVYDSQTGKHSVGKVAVDNIIAWRKNTLNFENASFDEIARTLERWYNVSITLENNAGNYRHYTVSFNNEPVDKVLRVLKSLSGMNYHVNANQISINLQNCKRMTK